MATRKRRHFPELEAHQERKRRLAAGLAQRQGAALDKEARERLEPLIETTFVDPPTEFKFDTSAFDRIKKGLEQAMLSSLKIQNNWIWPPSTWQPSLGSITFHVEPAPPTVSAARLEALKSAQPYKAQPQVPDMVHVITGWRGWGVSGMRLTALGQSHEWPRREAMQAACTKSLSHLSPDWDCSCGIWAFKDVDKAVAAIGASYRGVRVIGSVSLWGKVIETENGYRAQYAYPSELWLLDESLEDLSILYDVPIRK